MVLLTSSQVSVLLSSAIVISCTAALFLSGYVIQQRTLTQLRAAIKPGFDPRPSPKTSYKVPDHLKSVGQDAPLYADGRKDQVVIEVNPTVPEQRQKKAAGQKGSGWTSDMWQKMVSGSEKEEEGVSREELEKLDERERNIKGWKVKDQKHPDPEANSEKPISRAERRRLIKEEIKRLSQGEEPVYYQRRLW
ncbi:hypothetical protein Cob_v005886 [Colletotrichum orbiculare MAFF 240422]|uniref:Uncharacterized protein n=1 Tax=Colletotrichum orbiculare (strain 104-T / ATCC 96160 / CBS 514.97 / LARS 414 / MAFF 240422) TaxID=1213857 RepID=N4VFE8_COLOR|nr:hypothetical protein Cob_v005886 [Colletotrichum orbiculare MAFF 240422]